MSPLRVLQSVKPPGPRTNPYVVQLVGSLRDEGLDVRWFGWRTALLGRYDVLHLHWPEVMVRRDGLPGRVLARARTALLLARLSVDRRVKVVRTRHNLAAHEGGGRLERLLLDALDRRTDHDVLLNAHTPPRAGIEATLVPHGDYRAWFARHPQGPPIPGRVLHFGLIRPYKGVERLLEVAGAVGEDRPFGLRVVGSATTAALAAAITEAAAADARISADLSYVDDAALAREVSAASLVVLPYAAMHNSGALLLALSLGRPVLVPGNPVTDDLAAEVGEGWVHRYDGELSAAALTAALAAGVPAEGPELGARSWPVVAGTHAALYRRLSAGRGSGRRWRARG